MTWTPSGKWPWTTFAPSTTRNSTHGLANPGLPASQRWALQDILRSAEAPGGRKFEQAHDALTVARPSIVLRDLSAIRRRQQEGELGVAEAAEEIVEAVQRHGLRPMEVPEEPGSAITPAAVGVVCYQVVLPPTNREHRQ